jgi:hypothetical protein
MNNVTTKRQHLVWRKYLAPWTDDISSTEGNISWLLKDKNQVMPRQGINDVAVERYTYDISMINETDKKIVRQYYDKWLNSQSFLQLKSRINDTEDIFKKDYIENNYICPIEYNGIGILNSLYNYEFPYEGPTLLEKTVELLKKYIINSLYSNEPILSEEGILELPNYALNKDEIDRRYNFYEFISVQMLRTWKSKDVTKSSIKDTIEKYPDSELKNTTDALFPLMMIVNSIILATAFCKNNFYVQLIDNKSNQDFITGDLPVINLCANYNEVDDTINRMELYYPISPRIAIICKNTIKNNETIQVNDETVIDMYNKKIFDAAVKQVFATKDSDLDKYKNK